MAVILILLQVSPLSHAQSSEAQQTTKLDKSVPNKPAGTNAQTIKNLEKVLAHKDNTLHKMQDDMKAMMKNINKFDAQNTQLNRQVTQQLENIARLNEQLERRERANNMQWFSRGAILGVIALIIGYLMGIFARKQRRSKGDRRMM